MTVTNIISQLAKENLNIQSMDYMTFQTTIFNYLACPAEEDAMELMQFVNNNIKEIYLALFEQSFTF